MNEAQNMKSVAGDKASSELENILLQFDNKLDRLEKLVVVVGTCTGRLGDFQQCESDVEPKKATQLTDTVISNLNERLSRLQAINNSLGGVADNLTRIVG